MLHKPARYVGVDVRSGPLPEIQKAVSEKSLEVELTKIVEAQEFRETLAMRRDVLHRKETTSLDSISPASVPQKLTGLPATL